MKHLHQLQSALNRYALLERRHYISGTDRREDDASHSLSVAMICWHYYTKLQLSHLSEVKILKYALVHDLVEIYAGDVMTYADTKARAQKEIDEQRAFKQLAKEFAEDTDLVSHLRDYQTMANEEASFVWTCDKIQAYTQGSLDNWRAYLEHPITKQMFTDKLHQQINTAPESMHEEFGRLMKIWIASYPEV